jgi:hypothetical protein
MIIFRERSHFREDVIGTYGRCSAWTELDTITKKMGVTWGYNRSQTYGIPMEAALAIVDLAKKVRLAYLSESTAGSYGNYFARVEKGFGGGGMEVVWGRDERQTHGIPMEAALAIVDLAKKVRLSL